MGMLSRVIKMLWNYIVWMAAQPYECTKIHCIVHFKTVSFMVCELHLKKRKDCFAVCERSGRGNEWGQGGCLESLVTTTISNNAMA